MRTISTISKHDIRTFVGEQNFLKGKQTVRDGAIVNPELKDEPIIKLHVDTL
jgi:hypothetical protein